MAAGDDLADILEDEEMTGGDFVRNVKQMIDLLRQIAEVAPDADTAAAARAAPTSAGRGVVAASSTGHDPERARVIRRAVIRPGESWGIPRRRLPTSR